MRGHSHGEPSSFESLCEQARRALAEGRSALSFCRRLLAERSRTETASEVVESLYLMRLNQLTTGGHWREAAELSRELLVLLPRSLQGHLCLSASYRALGKAKPAAALEAKASRLNWRGLPRLEDRFQCLMITGRFAEAFTVAENILDEGSFLSPHALFWNPWKGYPHAHCRARDLRALDRLAAARRSPWVFYYRGELRGGSEGLADFERLAGIDPARYGWMNIKAGVELLYGGRFPAAVARLTASLRYHPVEWKARGYLAEALLCVGRREEARRQLMTAAEEAPRDQRPYALAWLGQLELWLGRYARAWELLDEACAQGAQHAFCWRAAAALKLGRRRQALKLLDETIRRFPIDQEAYVWRGEAKRELGLHREALADLDRCPGWLWAHWNKALVLAALKDEDGLFEAFRRIPGDVVARLRRKLRLPPPETSREVVRLLEAGRRLSLGFRRDDFGQAAWLPAASGEKRRK